MSPLLRGSLFAVSVTGAFAAGYFLKPTLAPVDAGQTSPVAIVPSAPTGVAISAWTKGDAPVAGAQKTTAHAPDIQLPELPSVKHDLVASELPPVVSIPAPNAPALDLSDPGLRMVKDALNIKTTVLDKTEPPLPVLTPPPSALNPPPHVLPTASPIVECPPIPMTGPTPRLDAPPIIGVDPLVPPSVEAPKVDVPPLPAKLVNSRDVALDFEVTKTGVSKVSSVELWTTRDGGKNWAKTDQMAGCQSPFRTRLGSDGEYGFRLVFESESGMRTPEPKSNDKPDLRMELDTTPPKVVLFSPAAIPGQADKVRLLWEMSDAHLDSGYARLEYSEDGKAWLPIAVTTIPSQQGHHFDWTLPPGVPPQVMIRVTARDFAGNQATATSTRKVSIDLVAPQGKLTGVRPATGLEIGPKPGVVTLTPVAPIDSNRAIFSFWVGMLGE